ncbi:SURF1 family protein [Arthrobacter burdickii]|uniref:SURF1-like protein n=1 Tax=Arthrobacter burdickii TaxID=3035920 RepID=A0ABT8K3F6_9MICC|nr:SURF1 family protein [Arthrobacter burdickii]MDN4610904.1 SURF1 family protein [Arthrobacter burdickii]
MLKTALKPRWILTLILAMTIAAVFVLLSQWQFNSSREAPPPAPSATENVRPLTGVLQPGTPLSAANADQMVSFEGVFLADTRVLVQDRLLGDEEGLWVLQAFEVGGSGVPAGTDGASVIPVVLGWVPDAGDAASVPERQGAATVVGRLLPPEAPEVQRPVAGQVPTLSTAELSNLWDRSSYAAFVVASDVAVDGVEVPFAAGLEPVVVGPQPQETPVNWLNIFYAVEWVVFAGFAFFLWWRLVADDYRRTLEDEADAAEEARPSPPGAVEPAVVLSPPVSDHESGAHRD